MTYRTQQQLTYISAALPAVVFLLVLLWPLGTAIHTALTDAMGRWTGEHVRAVYGDPLFRRALRFNLLIPIASVTLEAVVGLGMALWFYHLRRGRTLWRTIAIVPFAVPEIVYLMTMKLMFRQHGYANSFISMLGGEELLVGWLQPESWLLTAVVIVVDAWRVTPVVFLIVLAALDRMPESYIEAARIDGASWWSVMSRIQIPLAVPALLVALALRAIDAFRIFAPPLVLAGVQGLPVLTTTAYHYQADAHNAAAANVAALTLAFGLVLSTAVIFVLAARRRAGR